LNVKEKNMFLQDLFHRSSKTEVPIKLKYDLIKHITGGFTEERVVGTGAFGKVYRVR
jgi:hypothetical protein